MDVDGHRGRSPAHWLGCAMGPCWFYEILERLMFTEYGVDTPITSAAAVGAAARCAPTLDFAKVTQARRKG